MVQFGKEVLGDLREVVDVAAGLVLQLEFETARHGVTGNHRRLEYHDVSVLDLLACACVKLSENGFRAFFLRTFAPVFQLDDERTVGVTLSGKEAVADDLRTVVDCRNVGQNFVHFVHHFDGAFL